MPNYILWVYAGNSNYDGILWCVIWHFSSLKVWTEGPTVTKDSETLGVGGEEGGGGEGGGGGGGGGGFINVT